MMVFLKSLLALSLALGMAGCATTKGGTTAERQEYVNKMAIQALQDLYERHPYARERVENAAGYAVFSNINTNLILVSTKGGYGVAVDGKTGERTYMKMASAGVGPGIGVRDARWIMIFQKPHDFAEFVDNGWGLSGEATMAAKSERQGGSASSAGDLNRDVVIYQLTESGVALGASIDGNRFWQDDDLNGEIDRQPASRQEDGNN